MAESEPPIIPTTLIHANRELDHKLLSALDTVTGLEVIIVRKSETWYRVPLDQLPKIEPLLPSLPDKIKIPQDDEGKPIVVGHTEEGHLISSSRR